MNRCDENFPLVSICVPVYNVQDFIEECAESLFCAKMADKCEFIFVDDCSPDGSIALLRSVMERHPNMDVKIIRHEKNRGLAAARNTAVQSARGQYIAHVDSDDSIKENFIQTLYSTAVSEQAELVVCEAGQYVADMDIDVFVRDECLKEKIRRAQKDWAAFSVEPNENREVIRLLLEHQLPASIWCKFARRSLYADNGVVWKEGINVGEDVITSVKLLFHSQKTRVIPDNLYNYRKFIGFVMKLKRKSFFTQKELEFAEIKRFAVEHGFFDEIAPVIELRNAEIKYEFLKNESPFSLKKYCFMKEQNLAVLCRSRKDFNKKSTRLLVRLIDGRHFFLSNALYGAYKIILLLKSARSGS
ncbi:MAG: glycosyltransferase family 2 protein [Treponema sp.]|nr:glycosyltransferase family 2 protein [Treponema sp.]